MCTIALLSDTHGFIDPRIRTAAAACDWIVHAGDIGSGDVLRELESVARGLVAVRGNNDVREKWARGERRLLDSIPEHAELSLPGGVLVVTHGHRVLPAAQRHARLRQRFPHARAIVYGHSHHLVTDRSHTPWVLNPGAAGRARTHGGPSWLLLSAGEAGWRVRAFRYPPGAPTRRRA